MNRLSTDERQKQIKKAVLDIIASEGLHHLSTRNLAKAVGISEGAIFRHFKSKQSILIGVMEDVRQKLIRQLRVIALSDAPPPVRLAEYLHKHLAYLYENQGITILLFSEAAHLNDVELKQHFFDILNEKKRYVSKIFQDGIAEGIWDNHLKVEHLAMLYMGIPITLNIELVLNAEPVNLESFCKNMLMLLERVLHV